MEWWLALQLKANATLFRAGYEQVELKIFLYPAIVFVACSRIYFALSAIRVVFPLIVVVSFSLFFLNFACGIVIGPIIRKASAITVPFNNMA